MKKDYIIVRHRWWFFFWSWQEFLVLSDKGRTWTRNKNEATGFATLKAANDHLVVQLDEMIQLRSKV